ncbi:esterase, PHB depolymerase family [Roseivivax marinus]|uniref:extracellular catalytic domain type 1 short-chain-length polyhydroxyalkanoate depolymerase n=1 Tax=Roseivivax marinus TaxID=1379903 RepID=UPI0008D8ACCC|nr:PHB depolymerase family esterase [Roseivivax marinus]SEL19698.1 esterase, PHB depolymerase family [Roseivivax marinus]
MNDHFATAMRRALEQTRAGDPHGATSVLQAALSGQAPDAAPCCGPCAEAAEKTAHRGATGPMSGLGLGGGLDLSSLPGLEGGLGLGRQAGMPGTTAARALVPEGATVETRRHSGAAGSRSYRLFVPSERQTPLQGVVLMLHGCTQGAEDFAVGTRMDVAAEAAGFVVAYPEQTGRHNAQSCWNWFRPEDQARTGGEAALLADLGHALAEEFSCEGRVFAAGLSAGGAMAAILGESHPDVFRATGVHSGLPAGAARDVVSAFAAMRGEGTSGRAATGPVIVFHGSADRTVAPANGSAIVGGHGIERTESGNGRTWTRLVTDDGSELWRVEGAGHAWFGGDPAGSYADPKGPDASTEMLRFFAERGQA